MKSVQRAQSRSKYGQNIALFDKLKYYIIKKKGKIMPEVPQRPEVARTVVPASIGAVFETGRLRPYVFDWVTQKDRVPVLDVRERNQRMVWALENIRVFRDGTLPNPERQWKPTIDDWLTDIKTAASAPDPEDPRIRLERKEFKEVQKSEQDILAMMAVSASARAMEQSAGVAEKYMTFITVDGDLDKQDSWAEFFLHRHPEKLNRVISNPLVKHYYERLLEDAGFKDVKEWRESAPGKWRPSRWKRIEIRKAREGKLAEYLKFKKVKYKGGLNEYIAGFLLKKDEEEFIKEQLEKGFGDTCRWAAARLACDAFLVDKYTRWEFAIDKKGKHQMKPSPGWGGDPLRTVLEPSFLPRRIKKMYQKEDEAILAMMDQAFRPKDIFKGNLKKELLPPSMVAHLKRYFRYSSALGKFLGSSRGIAIPQWTEKYMYEELPTIAELIDQVYGGTFTKAEPNMGKHIVGAMMTRILQCKALATAVESARPGFRENIALLFGAETARPFLKIEQYLWGPNLDAKRGFLASLAGGRTRFVFKNNRFKAERDLRDAWEILSTNDQDPQGRGKAKMLNTVGFILDAAKVIAAGGKGK